jgi:hypothetical protein
MAGHSPALAVCGRYVTVAHLPIMIIFAAVFLTVLFFLLLS